MGLGSARLRLTGQMRCSHLAMLFKFSVKDIIHYSEGIFAKGIQDYGFFVSSVSGAESWALFFLATNLLPKIMPSTDITAVTANTIVAMR